GEHEPTLRVADHHRPNVRAARVASPVVRPHSVRGIVTRLRDRIPAPAQRARLRVERADLAARGGEAAVVRDRGADDDERAYDEWRRRLLIGGELERRDPQALPQIDAAA